MKNSYNLLKYILILIIILLILLFFIRTTNEGFENNSVEVNDIIYIKKAEETESESLYPILKNVFPNKEIRFVSNNSRYDLTIISLYQAIPDTPFIYTSGERASHSLNRISSMKHKNCIMNLVTTTDSYFDSIPNKVYFPFFLNVGPIIYNSSPFVRNSNINRPYLAAYIASYSPAHRKEMFNVLRAKDSTVDGLGKANHTKEVVLPKDWWDLPEIYKDYKFGFAMENTNEDGYITEKIMNVYRGGAIPIYWGTSKVKSIFNPESFVYVLDYASFEDCAADIIAIRDDPTRYEAMRNAPIFLATDGIDYSKYYDNYSPQWVIDIANRLKESLYKVG